MADTYSVRTQYPSTEFLGGTNTRDVMTVGIVTKPSGVYVEFDIPQAVYSAEQVAAYATGYSGTVEQTLTIPGVVDLSYVQDVTPGGQLQPGFIVYVQSDSGNSTGQLTEQIGNLLTEPMKARVAALVEQLNEAEQ